MSLCLGIPASQERTFWLCRQDLKELKFRPSTDVHDYQVRLRSAQKFIAKVTDSALFGGLGVLIASSRLTPMSAFGWLWSGCPLLLKGQLS